MAKAHVMASGSVWGLIGSGCMIWQEHAVLQEQFFYLTLIIYCEQRGIFLAGACFFDNLLSTGGYVYGRSKFFT